MISEQKLKTYKLCVKIQSNRALIKIWLQYQDASLINFKDIVPLRHDFNKIWKRIVYSKHDFNKVHKNRVFKI